MVSIATATLKCSLSKWGCDEVEQTAVSEHVKYSRQRKLTQTNVRLRPASQFGQLGGCCEADCVSSGTALAPEALFKNLVVVC